MKKYIAFIVAGVDMSGNLPDIMEPNLPDVFIKALPGEARQGKAGQGLITARRISPSECYPRSGPARTGVPSMGEVRSGKHWQGLLAAVSV